MSAAILSELARVKVLFQLRTIEAVIRGPVASPSLTATPAVSVNAAAPEAAPVINNTSVSGAGTAAGIGSEL